MGQRLLRLWLLVLASAAGAAPFAYIPHDNGVTVIDVANVQSTSQIGMSGPVLDIAARPGDTRAYAVSTPIRVIDIRTQSETLQIETRAGALVARLPAASLPAGAQSLSWDDTTTSGVKAPNGAYVARVISTSAVGTSELSAPFNLRG